MRIAVAREIDANEDRVAATPETVKKMKGLGADIAVEPDAGTKSGILDAEFAAAGATLSNDAVKDADVVLKVRRPAASELARYKKGALVIAMIDPYGEDAALKALAGAGIVAFAMELMPRITRAQSMDVLSSQANLAGYRAVIDGAAEYGRALPMMMTAAGTVPAAKVFIMGVGVAGLQAIATARRLGAIVTATDVRPATKEQVQSLGAKFVAVEDEEGGNCPLSEYGKTVEKYGVKIIGPANLPGELATDSSSLFARNLLNFITPMVDKETKALKIDIGDEVVKGTLVTQNGQIVHPALSQS